MENINCTNSIIRQSFSLHLARIFYLVDKKLNITKGKDMSKTKQQKIDILSGMTDSLSKSKSVVFTINKGINAEEMVALRKKIFASNSKYEVTKKTLLKIALKNANIDIPLGDEMAGAINTVYSFGDEILGPKTIYEFIKDSQHAEIVGGIYEGKFLTKEQVISLATMPSKDELYAKLVGSLHAPISGFVNVLAGSIRNFVQVVNAVKEKKEASA